LRASVSALLGSPRRRAREWLLRLLGVLVARGLDDVARRSDRRRGIALVYHRIGDPPGALERELLPALGSALFHSQMRYLASRYRIVPASELLEAARERRRGERFPVAVTFDDDLRSHVDVAAPLLESAGATATFFVCGASLHAPHRPWWERLQVAVDRGLDLSPLNLPAAGGDIHDLARTIEALSPRKRDELDARLERLVGPDPPDAGLRADDLQRLAAFGFEIGFHTLRHYHLPPLSADALEAAFREGRNELEQVVGQRLRVIAYPHGAVDGRVAVAARAAGFQFGFSGRGQPITPDANPLLLGRLSPSYDSVGELAFDVAWALGTTRRR
jgi:peptidoglycan/xylan/chitin deacetylase (PgdA/CDA1 family)